MPRKILQLISIFIGLFFALVLVVGIEDTINTIRNPEEPDSVATCIISCIFVATVTIVFLFIVPRKIPKGEKSEKAQTAQAKTVEPWRAAHDIQIAVQPESPLVSQSPVKKPMPAKPQPEPEKAERKKSGRIADMSQRERDEIWRNYGDQITECMKKGDLTTYRYVKLQMAEFRRKEGSPKSAIDILSEVIMYDANGYSQAAFRSTLSFAPENMMCTLVAPAVIRNMNLCQKALGWTDKQLRTEIVYSCNRLPLFPYHFIYSEDAADLFFANRDGNEKKAKAIGEKALQSAMKRYPQLNFFLMEKL